MQFWKICKKPDSQNWDFPNRKQGWQTAVGISSCVLLCTVQHNYLSIIVTLNVEIKMILNISLQNLLIRYCPFLCYELHMVQIKFWKERQFIALLSSFDAGSAELSNYIRNFHSSNFGHVNFKIIPLKL
jgi:hypothetical protein